MDTFETPAIFPPESMTDPPTIRHANPSDRPLYLALYASAVVGVATVPVLLAVIGETESLLLIVFPAALIGAIAGCVGLAVAGVASNLLRAWRGYRARSARRRRAAAGKVADVPQGRLAFD